MLDDLTKYFLLIFLALLVALIGFTKQVDQDWILFTNGSDINQLLSIKSNIVVSDYSADGTEKTEFSYSDISQLKSTGKKVFAYVNLGIAENWRFYWKNLNKSIILSPLEGWKGEYYVKYWYREWYDVMRNYLNRVKKSGFDGVMFDWTNVYKHETLQKITGKSEKDLKIAMFELINTLTRDFNNFQFALVNGEEILNDYPILVNRVKYVVVESLFFDRLKPNTLSDAFQQRIKILTNVQKMGVTVLSVEYIDNGNPFDKENVQRINQYIELAKKYNFLYYIARYDMKLTFPNVPRISLRNSADDFKNLAEYIIPNHLSSLFR